MATRRLPSQYDAERVRFADPARFVVPNGDELKAIRVRLGLRQQDVARRTGLCIQTVARVERETVDPASSTVRRMLELYSEVSDLEAIE